jgi:DNA-binding MarR family transcriptional regulator
VGSDGVPRPGRGGRGYVQRLRNASDGRLVRVSLTEAGERKIEELFPRFNAEEAAVTAHLSPDQQDAMAAMLRSLLRTTGDA